MSNHVHFIAVPEHEESLSRALRDAHTVYAMRFNMRAQMTGHVWQGRFYSCPLDGEHLWAAVRYVERNPVRAGMIGRAEEYRWSSAPAHCGLGKDSLLSGDFPAPGIVENWAEWLVHEDDAEITDRIRRKTNTGRPCDRLNLSTGWKDLWDERCILHAGVANSAPGTERGCAHERNGN